MFEVATEAASNILLASLPLLDRLLAEKIACSVRVSLASQGLFINDVAVRFAAQLLYELFSRGRLTQHGVVVNLDSKRSGPIEVDPQTWERFGYILADKRRDGEGAVAEAA
ncbi:ubiquitin-activating E1 family protein [Pseudothauera nasutitermitis]|uniref:hypothetical protein n=1 Tax=Pseudothauera nasutitermitis TaxID=2565930 RepID=UPI001E529F41|nr:hypothetical protein [Pseudothauera nasutitermitis]